MQNVDYDVFCSGVSVLPDGRPLIVGGTASYSFTGDNRATFFDPATGNFNQAPTMVDGRWYATATVLGDGRLMAFSGLNKTTGAVNKSVEIYDPANPGQGWLLATPSSAFPQGLPLYPHMALLPSGKVFYTGHGAGSTAQRLDLRSGGADVDDIGAHSGERECTARPSCCLSPRRTMCRRS